MSYLNLFRRYAKTTTYGERRIGLNTCPKTVSLLSTLDRSSPVVCADSYLLTVAAWASSGRAKRYIHTAAWDLIFSERWKPNQSIVLRIAYDGLQCIPRELIAPELLYVALPLSVAANYIWTDCQTNCDCYSEGI